jgi:hypothetical protein
VVSDGLRTLERVNPMNVWGLWLSAALGIVALAYLLVVAPGLYLTQSFLAIGDQTPANVVIAVLSGARRR